MTMDDLLLAACPLAGSQVSLSRHARLGLRSRRTKNPDPYELRGKMGYTARKKDHITRLATGKPVTKRAIDGQKERATRH